jgi:GT2 family glycosyltransferase
MNPRARETGTPDASVIVVVHNSAPFIEKCLAAVRAGLKEHSYELILVDNASTDGTRDAIPPELEPSRTIVLDSNIGFPRANNVAIEQSRGRLLVLVNSDAFPDPGSIDRLIRAMDRRPRAGIIGAKLRYPNGKPQPSFGRFPSLVGGLWTAFFLHRVPLIARLGIGVNADPWLYRQPRRVEWVTGAFCVARRTVGPVPARALMYGDDVEWGARCRDAGLEVWFEPSATAVHIGRIVDQRVDPGFAQVYRVEFELSWFARNGRLKALLARAVLVIHALLRLGIYAPLEIFPRSGHRRLREHLVLLRSALTWRASGSKHDLEINMPPAAPMRGAE